MPAKVMVAMSGGVDSSVAAYLLLRAGYDCVGATMKLYDDSVLPPELRRGYTCCSLDDVEDARSVARRMGIPHYVFNLREEFDRFVMRRFSDAYARGDTPNPCVDCNRYLKFGFLLQRAKELGMDYIATGHYARICLDPSGGRYALRKGRESARDQSYFLSSMNQEQLRRTLFPLGGLTKGEVRRIAEEQGFVNAKKHDSQDICFVPDGDYGAFLERYTGRPSQPGDILDREGRVLGRHAGAVRYTLGQRKGLGVSASEPLYVCGKSMERNTVTLGPESALYSAGLLAEDFVWGTGEAPDVPVRVSAKTRSRHPGAPAIAQAGPDGTVQVRFDAPQRAVTTGQTVALYRGDQVLGGGVIREVFD